MLLGLGSQHERAALHECHRLAAGGGQLFVKIHEFLADLRRGGRHLGNIDHIGPAAGLPCTGQRYQLIDQPADLLHVSCANGTGLDRTLANDRFNSLRSM